MGCARFLWAHTPSQRAIQATIATRQAVQLLLLPSQHDRPACRGHSHRPFRFARHETSAYCRLPALSGYSHAFQQAAPIQPGFRFRNPPGALWIMGMRRRLERRNDIYEYNPGDTYGRALHGHDQCRSIGRERSHDQFDLYCAIGSTLTCSSASSEFS
jgi:hypothetical protein